MCHWDALFYIIAQFIGGTLAVYIMQLLMGSILIDSPVHSAVTVPGAGGIWPALIIEFMIAFITMTMVLFTSNSDKLKNYTRPIAGLFVCSWVIIAGPISGFGMNPARSFASAFPANIYTAFWIYMIIPFAGMLTAAEVFLKMTNKKSEIRNEKVTITSNQ
jgi:aquaporin Z